MEFAAALPILAGIAAVHLLAVASPGPTMAVVMSHALSHDRRSAALVAFGVWCATLIWASLAAAGLGSVLKNSPEAYRTLQYAGAGYLAYLGARILIASWRALKARRKAANDNDATAQRLHGLAAWRTGFITNMTNPNTIAYFAALFGVLVPADASRTLFWSAAVTVLCVSLLWWISVVLFFSLAPVRRGYERIRPVADVVMGLMLVGIGVRLAVGG